MSVGLFEHSSRRTFVRSDMNVRLCGLNHPSGVQWLRSGLYAGHSISNKLTHLFPEGIFSVLVANSPIGTGKGFAFTVPTKLEGESCLKMSGYPT